jgi:hypothetical protein
MTATLTTLLRLLPAVVAVAACLSVGPARAERWQEHRAVALQAIEDVDYVKAIEQLEAALYYARALPAADRDLSDLWENLAATYLADQQYQRAWDSITHWDAILAANAGQAWAAAQQPRRDQMTRMLFEVTRSESGEPAGEAALLSDLAPAAESEPIDRPATVPTRDGDSASPAKVAALPKQNGAAKEKARTTAENAAAVDEAGAYGLHLASYSNEADARSGWNTLQTQYPDVLNGKRYTLRSIDLGDRGVFLRLIAVPFADSAAAGNACAELRARAQYCVVMKTN